MKEKTFLYLLYQRTNKLVFRTWCEIRVGRDLWYLKVMGRKAVQLGGCILLFLVCGKEQLLSLTVINLSWPQRVSKRNGQSTFLSLLNVVVVGDLSLDKPVIPILSTLSSVMIGSLGLTLGGLQCAQLLNPTLHKYDCTLFALTLWINK